MKSPNSQIYINRDKTLRFTLKVKDIIKNTDVILNHTIDNSKSCNIINKTNIQVNPYQFNYEIPIPSNITPGTYEIGIVVRDQNKQISKLDY